MKGLKMEQEADFSEPEQVKLAQPVLAPNPASDPALSADRRGLAESALP